MTLGSLRTAVTQKLGLSASDQPLVDQWILEGIIDVLVRTSCHVECATLMTSPGVGDYTIDADVLSIEEIVFGAGSAEAVAPRTLLDLRANGGGSGTRFALEGSNLLMLYPTPSAVETIKIYFTRAPRQMTAPSDDPANPVFGGVPLEYQKAIEFFALREGADYDDDRSSAVGQAYDQELEREYQKIRRHMNRRLGRMPRARVGRGPVSSFANDVYPVL